MRHGRRHVVCVAFPDVQVLDVTGPLEVFGRAARLLVEHAVRRDLAYSVEIVGPEAGPIETSSGITIVAKRRYRDVRGNVDTLLVAGGRGSRTAAEDPTLRAWLARIAPRVRRLGSVCTGTFILAVAGLLDGKRATTHWGSCATLAKLYPRIAVESDPIFVRDGHVYTSAGVTAGMDLALAMVEEDFGRARRVDCRSSRRRPFGDGTGRTGLDEPAPLRTRVHCGDAHDTGPIRRSAAGRGSPPAARGIERRRRAGCSDLRVRRCRSDAARVSAHGARVALRLSQPVPFITPEERGMR